jgi:UDP-N-acetylmuramyl pentapeptide phosphotransferase/UDP-N-acetylglucosamine-1-phosphate transferase
MNQMFTVGLYAVASCLLTWALTGVLLKWLIARARVATPTDRGMHTTAIPIGGGLAIIMSIAALWPLATRPLVQHDLTVLLASIGLCLISWIDDRRPLWPITRLFVQSVAVAIAISALPTDWRIAPMVPLVVEQILLGLAWVWVINLYNFMDGIDGLAGGETVAIGVGFAATVLLASVLIPGMSGRPDNGLMLASIMAGAALGYLVWNWHPARIFMGDCGAIPLGFLVGWLMITLIHHRLFASALILPLYFLVDATWTLCSRLIRGAVPWQAHREHAYQQAVLFGQKPNEVVRQIMIVNVLLMGFAVASINYPIPAMIGAAAAVLVLMIHLKRPADLGADPSVPKASENRPPEAPT